MTSWRTLSRIPHVPVLGTEEQTYAYGFVTPTVQTVCGARVATTLVTRQIDRVRCPACREGAA